jgi:hypothetical protein
VASRTLLVVDWAGMDAPALQALRQRHSPAMAEWSLRNCLPRPAGRMGKALRYALAAIRLAWPGQTVERVVLWQQWIGYLWCLLPHPAARPRVVICTVLYAPSNSPPGSLRRWLLARALQRADALLYFSAALAEETRRAWPQWAHKVHSTRLPLLDAAEPVRGSGDGPGKGPGPTAPNRPLRVFAGGSSERDFDIVVKAFRATDVPVTLVCRGDQKLPPDGEMTPNITVHRDVPEAMFHALACDSDIAVIALRSAASGCGQLLFTFCMRHRIALIVTEAHGTRDYVQHEHTGLSIPVGDAKALRAAHQRLSAEPALRMRLQNNAQALARELSFAQYALTVDAL